MTQEMQRIAIAGACGAKWQTIHDFPSKVLCFDNPRAGLSVMRTELTDGRILAPDIPNYLNDLSAMHEAEKVLDLHQTHDYHHRLADSTKHPKDAVVNAERWTFHATAAQRAEAFLKTLNLWKP